MTLWEFGIMVFVILIYFEFKKTRKEFEELNNNLRMLIMNDIKNVIRSGKKTSKN